MSNPLCPQHTYYQPLGAGDSYTMPDARFVFIFDPAGGSFSGFTVTLPRNPLPDQWVILTATATISGVVLHAQPGQNLGPNVALSTISPTGAGQRFVWRAPASTWYQMP